MRAPLGSLPARVGMLHADMQHVNVAASVGWNIHYERRACSFRALPLARDVR